MGYTGRIVVARSAEPLSGLDGAKVLTESAWPGGWRSAQLDGDLRGTLPALVAATGAPAITAFIIDSDVADVEAATPAGVNWHVYLHPEQADDYGAPELEQTPAEVVEAALTWATEAGLTANGEAVQEALDASNVFAEETFHELLQALGVAPA